MLEVQENLHIEPGIILLDAWQTRSNSSLLPVLEGTSGKIRKKHILPQRNLGMDGLVIWKYTLHLNPPVKWLVLFIFTEVFIRASI